jgi:predicted choloylglycine hydrolase
LGDSPIVINDADKVDYRPRIYDNPGSTWEMTEDGLRCLDCKEE